MTKNNEITADFSLSELPYNNELDFVNAILSINVKYDGDLMDLIQIINHAIMNTGNTQNCVLEVIEDDISNLEGAIFNFRKFSSRKPIKEGEKFVRKSK